MLIAYIAYIFIGAGEHREFENTLKEAVQNHSALRLSVVLLRFPLVTFCAVFYLFPSLSSVSMDLLMHFFCCSFLLVCIFPPFRSCHCIVSCFLLSFVFFPFFHLFLYVPLLPLFLLFLFLLLFLYLSSFSFPSSFACSSFSSRHSYIQPSIRF